MRTLIPVLLCISPLAACQSGYVPPAMPLAEYQAAAPGPYPFDVQLKLSAETKQRLADLKEEVTVSAMFFGEPNAAGKKHADEMDQINLGDDSVNVPPVDQTVRITGVNLDKKALAWIEGEPMLLINVYTARKADENNLIDCGIFQDPIKLAQAKPIVIECSLLPPLMPAK